MEYKILGRTDLKVSAVCLGTMTFGDQVDEAGSVKISEIQVGLHTAANHD